MNSLKAIYDILENINRSINNKEDMLIQNLKDPIFGKILRKVLDYMTNPKYSFQIKQIKYCVYFDDPIASENQNVNSIFKMLDYLIEKEGNPSDEEIAFLEKISSSDMETVEVVTRILIKFPGCGLTNERIAEILEDQNVK